MYILGDIEYYYCFDPGPESASEDLSSSLWKTSSYFQNGSSKNKFSLGEVY